MAIGADAAGSAVDAVGTEAATGEAVLLTVVQTHPVAADASKEATGSPQANKIADQQARPSAEGRACFIFPKFLLRAIIRGELARLLALG